MRRAPTLDGQAGFSLVELLMAAFVLVVGILGTFALIDRANGAISDGNSRVGATNLARELVEHTRSLDYDNVTTGRLPAALHAKTQVPGKSNPWQVERRGVRYTVAVRVCLLDDPSDGLVPATFATGDADRPLCARPAPLNATQDTNPDDFRRLVVDLDWIQGGRARHLTQNALISNPAGGIGPRITAFPEPAAQFTAAETPGGSLVLGGITSTTAKAVHWRVDEGAGGGNATAASAGSSTSWTIGWDLGARDTGAPYVRDGSYVVTAQAFSDHGVPGDLRAVPVQLNRYAPPAPRDVAAGRNPRLGATHVDLRWAPSDERDVVGYRVYRIDPSGAARVCPATGGEAVSAAASCVDAGAPADGAVTYRVHAVDRVDLMNPASATRDGAAAEVTVSATAGTPPGTPVDLTASTVTGLPRLEWMQPDGVEGVAFYRIYRNGTGLEHRYAATITSDPFWNDPEPGNAATQTHTYRVAAVSPGLEESELSDPVSWSGP